MARLTLRERQILDLVVQGKTAKVIGRTIGISHRTVEVHLAKVRKKLGAVNVADLVRIACGIAAQISALALH